MASLHHRSSRALESSVPGTTRELDDSSNSAMAGIPSSTQINGGTLNIEEHLDIREHKEPLTPEDVSSDDWHPGHTRAADQRIRSALDTTRISIADRIRNLTWAWFTMTVSTGGFALSLYAVPKQFTGLWTIGKVIYILNIVLFIGLVVAITMRFVMTPSAFKASLVHPTEGLFFPASLLSLATILLNAAAYGIPSSGPWLPVALRVCFWIYAAVSLIACVIHFYQLACGERLPIQSMTPVWILPIFPAMLVGTLASTMCSSQPPEQRLPMMAAGISFQGLGWTVASLIYPLYLGRLMQDGLPAPGMRPGMFIAVGPPGFTAVALIGISKCIPPDYAYFAAFPLAPQIFQVMALWIAIWLWVFGFWFFCISCLAVGSAWMQGKLEFSMAWWAFVFPNVGFAIATGRIGQELGSEGVQWVATAMSILIAVSWVVVVVAQGVALKRRKLLCSQAD